MSYAVSLTGLPGAKRRSKPHFNIRYSLFSTGHLAVDIRYSLALCQVLCYSPQIMAWYIFERFIALIRLFVIPHLLRNPNETCPACSELVEGSLPKGAKSKEWESIPFFSLLDTVFSY
jgi:hypothetical protein